MLLGEYITLNAGGQGSGCNPEAGKCGRTAAAQPNINVPGVDTEKLVSAWKQIRSELGMEGHGTPAAGMCAVASVALYDRVFKGVKGYAVYSNGSDIEEHVFIKGHGVIIDPTADQYDHLDGPNDTRHGLAVEKASTGKAPYDMGSTHEKFPKEDYDVMRSEYKVITEGKK